MLIVNQLLRLQSYNNHHHHHYSINSCIHSYETVPIAISVNEPSSDLMLLHLQCDQLMLYVHFTQYTHAHFYCGHMKYANIMIHDDDDTKFMIRTHPPSFCSSSHILSCLLHWAARDTPSTLFCSVCKPPQHKCADSGVRALSIERTRSFQ